MLTWQCWLLITLVFDFSSSHTMQAWQYSRLEWCISWDDRHKYDHSYRRKFNRIDRIRDWSEALAEMAGAEGASMDIGEFFLFFFKKSCPYISWVKYCTTKFIYGFRRQYCSRGMRGSWWCWRGSGGHVFCFLFYVYKSCLLISWGEFTTS